MNIAQHIVLLRKENRLTQEQLAEVLGITRGSLSMYEIGKREPDLQLVVRIAQHFQVSTDFLLGVSKDRFPLSLDGLTEEDKQTVRRWLQDRKNKNSR